MILTSSGPVKNLQVDLEVCGGDPAPARRSNFLILLPSYFRWTGENLAVKFGRRRICLVVPSMDPLSGRRRRRLSERFISRGQSALPTWALPTWIPVK